MEKISIIVPVYKIKEPYLRKCIESLIHQSLSNLEIILVDDGSPDKSGRICDEYANNDNRIKVIHQSNKGVSAARNAGIKEATGTWITFVDADDWIEMDTCEMAFIRAEKLKIDILIFGVYVNYEDRVLKHPFYERDIDCFDSHLKQDVELRTMLTKNHAFEYDKGFIYTGCTCAKLINRNFLEDSKILFNENLVRGEDLVFYLNLYEKSQKISYYNKCFYHYRMNRDSATKQYCEDVAHIISSFVYEQLRFIEESKKPPIYYDIYYASTVSYISDCLICNYFHKGNHKRLYVRLKELRYILSQEPYRTAIKLADAKNMQKAKRRNPFYYKHNLLFLLWLDWKMYDMKHRKQ